MTRLNLTPYNPEQDLRDRAARAISTFSAERAAEMDPGVNLGPDLIDRETARNRERMSVRKEARQADRRDHGHQ